MPIYTYPRSRPIPMNELQAFIAAGALEREVERLGQLADAARDRGDRDAWALFSIQRRTTAFLRGQVLSMVRDGASPSDACLEVLAEDVARIRHRMPRSNANAALVDAERAARTEARQAPPTPPAVAEPAPRGRRRYTRVNRAAVKAMRDAGHPPADIIKHFRISRTHYYRLVGDKRGVSGVRGKA